MNYGEKADPNRVTFRLADSADGFAFRQDWEELLELTYSGSKGFRAQIMRIVHQPEDFTDEYLTKFVEETEGLIERAISRPVRLKLVPDKGA